MTTVSVSVPEDLRKRMAKLDEVNWSAVARNAFEERAMQIETIKQLAMKSKLTEADAKEIADKINADSARRFREYATRH